jgi:hypothetical protein
LSWFLGRAAILPRWLAMPPRKANQSRRATTKPMAERIWNALRQPKYTTATATPAEPAALPRNTVETRKDLARARSSLGKVSATVTELAGEKNPSPTPNIKRIASSEAKDQARPVKPVNTDQATTHETTTMREP